jgi:hypothetical protein
VIEIEREETEIEKMITKNATPERDREAEKIEIKINLKKESIKGNTLQTVLNLERLLIHSV